MSVTADPQAHTQMAPADEPPTPAPGETLAAAPPRGFLATGWAKFSDNAIPSLVVAVIAGLVLYSFNETSDRITRLEDSVNDRFTAVDARFTKLEDNIKADFTAIDARFTKLEDNIDARFTKLEDNIKADFTAVDARFTKLEDNIKADFTAVDARFTKLEDNIKADFTAVDARFTAVDARFTKLEEGQYEIAQTLAVLVALFEAGNEASVTAAGVAPRS